MATTEFILQGLTANSHLAALNRLFDLPDVERVVISVAYVSEAGAGQLKRHLATHRACTTIFAGIRNDTTSHQGLSCLNGIAQDLYTVDTGSRTQIFHPKIYLVRARQRSRMIVGSANLTLAGLNSNIEAGVLLEFDMTIPGDASAIDELEAVFANSLNDYPAHIVRVTKAEDLDALLAAGRLIDETKAVTSAEAGIAIAHGLEAGPDHENSDFLPMQLKITPVTPAYTRPSFLARMLSKPRTSNEHKEGLAEPAPKDTIVEATAPPKPILFDAPDRAYHGKEGPRKRARRLKREAIAKGKKWYFTGLPCAYGHIEDRLVSNGKCRECNRIDSERSNRLGLYR